MHAHSLTSDSKLYFAVQPIGHAKERRIGRLSIRIKPSSSRIWMQNNLKLTKRGKCLERLF